ncbi:glycosyltransferase family 4 protein [Ectothiorhodospira shaposhnikovii]|uniref:glycosyltransferase family 4 protein n=1 Tax=Ectothiorhodospira shaposhnikovii TaxID=1054 RepID=UPI0039A0EAF3
MFGVDKLKTKNIAPSGNIQCLLYVPWRFDMLGGVDVVVDYLWRGLNSCKGMGVAIAMQSWTKTGLQSDLEGRVFLSLNMPEPLGESMLMKFRYIMTLLRRMPELNRNLRFHGVEIVNAHSPTLNIFPLALLKKLRVWTGEIYLSFHGADVEGLKNNKWLWRFVASETNGVSSCSEMLAKNISKAGVFNGLDVEVIHNGIDYDRFCKSEPLGDEGSNIVGPYILNVGNYIPRKGQDDLLYAFSLIQKSWPCCSLVFAGGHDNGVWLRSLKEKCKDLGLGDCVYFFEDQSQSQIANLMRNAEMLVHVARHEPFGLVIIEAGATGLPVVATEVGGIPEIINDADFGLLVPPGDTRALADAIDKLLKSPDLRRSLGENLKRRVIEGFSVNNMVSRYKKFLGLSD